jgi:hypothetical protein
MMHQRSDFPEKALLRENHGEEQRIFKRLHVILVRLGTLFSGK